MKNLFVSIVSFTSVLLFMHIAYTGCPFRQKVATFAAEGQSNSYPIVSNANSSEGTGYKCRQIGSGLKSNVNYSESGKHMINNQCSKAE